jgi:hypothetical protein
MLEWDHQPGRTVFQTTEDTIMSAEMRESDEHTESFGMMVLSDTIVETTRSNMVEAETDTTTVEISRLRRNRELTSHMSVALSLPIERVAM